MILVLTRSYLLRLILCLDNRMPAENPRVLIDDICSYSFLLVLTRLEYLFPFDMLDCPCIQVKTKQKLLLRLLNLLVFEFKLNKYH
jgi:hypothetical protein